MKCPACGYEHRPGEYRQPLYKIGPNKGQPREKADPVWHHGNAEFTRITLAGAEDRYGYRAEVNPYDGAPGYWNQASLHACPECHCVILQTR